MHKIIKLALCLLCSVNYAHAATFGFGCLTNNSGDCGSVASLITVDVEGAGPDTYFQFNVGDGANAAVKEIFFDDALNLLDPTDYLFDESGGTASGGGVDFQSIEVPGDNFPAGNPISFSSDFSTQAENPSGDNKNGIDNGEWFGITFFGTDASLILAALGSGDLRVGIHVGSVGRDGDYSESLTTTVIPIPAAAWLFASALVGFFGFATRQKRPRFAA